MNIKKLLVVAALAACAGGASAAVTPCTLQPGTAVNPAQFPFDTGNVRIRGFEASACSGHFEGNPANLVTATNTLNGYTTGLFTPGGFTGLLQAATSPLTSGVFGAGQFQGLSFQVTDLAFGVLDTSFSINVIDNNAAAPNTPITLDLVIGLKAGDELDFYLFDDFVLNATNAGSYSVAILNNPQNSQNGLSNLYLFGRDVRSCEVTNTCLPPPPPPAEIPEPGSLALVGLALLGAAAARQRRRAR